MTAVTLYHQQDAVVCNGDNDPCANELSDERTPLLCQQPCPKPPIIPDIGALDDNDNNHQVDDQRSAPSSQSSDSIPLVQVVLLCIMSTQDPIAFFTIFPFINEQVERIGNMPPNNVGFWSGAVESLFSLTQMIIVLAYSRYASRLPRKPLLVISLLGSSLVSSLFGFSQKLWHMILLRCLTGFFSGSGVVVRTMLAETSTPSTQARVFSWYMCTRTLGSLLGPIMGGSLANLGSREGFEGITFLRRFPYAVPTLVSGGLGIVMALAAAVGIQETWKGKRAAREEGELTSKTMTMGEILQLPGVSLVLAAYNYVMFINLCYTAVIAVFMYTPVELGGLGFSPAMISMVQVILGLSQGFWMLVVFPVLQKRYGTGWLLRRCAVALPIFLAFFPIQNLFLSLKWQSVFWVSSGLSWVIGAGAWMAMICVQLCLNDISPDPSVNATLNGVAISIASGTRAFAPAAISALYAFGIGWGQLDGQLAWVCLIVIALFLIVLVNKLPERVQGRPRCQGQSEDRDGG